MADQIVECPNCRRRNRVPPAAPGLPRCGACHRPLPWITNADDETFPALAERASLPVLVHLWAVWCPPCRRVGPGLEHLAADLAAEVKLVRVEVNAAPRLVERLLVRAVPTLMIMVEGRVIGRLAGATRTSRVRAWLAATLGTPEARRLILGGTAPVQL